MRKNFRSWVLVPVLLGLLCAGVQVQAKQTKKPTEKRILGFVECARLTSHGVSAKAKLDTGAKTSSLDARNIEFFTKKGKKWVRFDFSTRDKAVPYVRMERPLSRHVRIKRHSTKTQRRAVVEMELYIAGRTLRGEFSLISRERFLYPILLGRGLLRKFALVDADETYLGGDNCRGAPAS